MRTQTFGQWQECQSKPNFSQGYESEVPPGQPSLLVMSHGGPRSSGDMLLSHLLSSDPALEGTTLCSKFMVSIFFLSGQRKPPRGPGYLVTGIRPHTSNLRTSHLTSFQTRPHPAHE